MVKPHSVLLGKIVRRVARLRGGGSALPGLFVEKIDRSFVANALEQLPHGVVLVSGTNGKTTTTKIVVELLESQGLKVFTNRTGSNFTRGIAAALLESMNARGKLKADIAVLELDEAHAVHFVEKISPRYCLLLNVMRDQLDRFGEVDHTAKLLHQIAEKTTDGVVINRDDPRLSSSRFLEGIEAPLYSFGVKSSLLKNFPSDDDMRSVQASKYKHALPECDDTQLNKLGNGKAEISFADSDYHVDLKINGIYNTLNAVGAVALCRAVMGKKFKSKKMFAALSNVTPAFGRGEDLTINGKTCQLVLVKNPSGFRLGLKSFKSAGFATMIAINDDYADGRDMSWLWDVDFDSLAQEGVAELSGTRAYDMALRLVYDEVAFSHVDTDLNRSLANFLHANNGKPKRIYCTYTAMLAIRRELAKITDVKEAL